MSITHDVTFEQDQLDRADLLPDWGDVIPFDGAPSPAGTDAAGMDAEALPFPEWAAIYAQEPWALDLEWPYFEDWQEAA
jgi:hypothetical protein